MPHDHHHCECQHERVKFCAKCKVVHCLDCKYEWFEACTRSHGWGYYYSSPITLTSAAGQSISNAPEITWSNPSTTVCEH